mmetsp:Transcript_23548/g.40178  ORF Transcript_23548/g.40178 Transcript_23548/m.40178 type:complete len:397 (-) Transcript_23548:4-1194(-)
MASTRNDDAFRNCHYCGKESSPSIKIRDWIMCFTVAYCSKDCQEKDWGEKEGHKSRCRPASSGVVKTSKWDYGTKQEDALRANKLAAQRGSGRSASNQNNNEAIVDDGSLGAQAFSIFANQIVSEVNEENAQLKEGNYYLQLLRDHLNSVEIVVNGKRIPFPGFESGEMTEADEACDVATLCLRMSEDSLSSFPLEKICALAESKVYISNHVAGTFPGIRYPKVAKIVGRNKVILFVEISENCFLMGEVNHLENDDMASIANDFEHWGVCFRIGEHLFDISLSRINSPRATFTPLRLNVPLTLEQRRVVALLKKSTATPIGGLTSADNICSSDDLRNLTFTVCCKSQYWALLDENKRLKAENESLSFIRETIGTIKIKHGNETICVSLANGFSPTS